MGAVSSEELSDSAKLLAENYQPVARTAEGMVYRMR
jgi:hypothetical protein